MTLFCRSGHRPHFSLCLLWIGVIILVVDQISKGLVSIYLPQVSSSNMWYPYGGIPLFHNFLGIEFSINHMTNTGAAWGLLEKTQFPLVFVRILLIFLLTLYLLFFNKSSQRAIPLILIIAGALGNVIDFFVYGHVIDMLHVVLWGIDFPVFNLADSAISIGVIWLLILSFFEKKYD